MKHFLLLPLFPETLLSGTSENMYLLYLAKGYLAQLRHDREPLYSKGAVIAKWLQSTSAQNSVPSRLKG